MFKDNLVGNPTSALSPNKLPTIQNVLARTLGIRQDFESKGNDKASF